MSFTSSLRDFSERTESNLEQVLRGTTISLFGKIIRRTPVKTGRLRGNWQTDINRPKSGELDRTGAAGAMSEVSAEVNRARLGDSIFMVNNLPYAKKIEDGGSDQAPVGMVKVTALEFETEINRRAGLLR